MPNVCTYENGRPTTPAITATATISARSCHSGGDAERAGPRDERGEAAAQRQREQQRGLDHRFDDAEARARDRVVGGLLVRGERDAIGERRRHARRDARRRGAICRRASQSRTASEQRERDEKERR